MRRGETASIWEALYGPNPLKTRTSTFPAEWGRPPAQKEARERWIADHVTRASLTQDGAGRHVRARLEARREDPSAQRERARERASSETRNRLRREELAALLLPLHLRQWR